MRALLVTLGLLGGLQTAPGWPEIRQQALTERLAGRTAEAIVALDAAVRRWPSNGEAQYELGDALLETAWLAGGGATPEGTAALERAAAALEEARRLLSGLPQTLAMGKLVTIYGEDGLNRPATAEPLARALADRDSASGIWPVALSRSQAAQSRCSDAARSLLIYRPRVGSDARLLLGLSMTDLMVRCPDLSDADGRPLMEAALAIADAVVAGAPEDRDAVMLQAAAATGLASRLPEGPERQRVEALGKAAFDRFSALNPTRQRARAGELPDNLYELFSYMSEFETDGNQAAAERLYARAQEVHGGSADFWRRASLHFSSADRLDEALAAIDRALALEPPTPPDLHQKAMLLEARAERTTDPGERKRLVDEAARWRVRADAAMPAPPPPPPPRPPERR